MTNEPIMKTLHFARRMEPFVERARLTDKHYDVGDVAAMNVVERSRKGMNAMRLKYGTSLAVEVRRFSSSGKPFRLLRASRPNSLCDVYRQAPPLLDFYGTWKTD